MVNPYPGRERGHNNQIPQKNGEHNPRLIHILTREEFDHSGFQILGASLDRTVMERLQKSHESIPSAGGKFLLTSVQDFKC